MNDEQKTQLRSFMPLAVVLRLKDGRVEGLVEHSFSMDTDAYRVRVFWSGKAYSMLGEHTINGLEDAEHNAKKPGDYLFDPLSDDCPIEVDWTRWLTDMAQQPGDKFAKRNAPFTVKPHGTWQLRALDAEKKLSVVEADCKRYREAYASASNSLGKLREIINTDEE